MAALYKIGPGGEKVKIASDGFSPEITADEGADGAYRLNIRTAAGSFATPDLRGGAWRTASSGDAGAAEGSPALELAFPGAETFVYWGMEDFYKTGVRLRPGLGPENFLCMSGGLTGGDSPGFTGFGEDGTAVFGNAGPSYGTGFGGWLVHIVDRQAREIISVYQVFFSVLAQTDADFRSVAAQRIV